MEEQGTYTVPCTVRPDERRIKFTFPDDWSAEVSLDAVDRSHLLQGVLEGVSNAGEGSISLSRQQCLLMQRWAHAVQPAYPAGSLDIGYNLQCSEVRKTDYTACQSKSALAAKRKSWHATPRVLVCTSRSHSPREQCVFACVVVRRLARAESPAAPREGVHARTSL